MAAKVPGADEYLFLCVLSEMGEGLEIRERYDDCKEALFSHHSLTLDNVFKKKH